MRQFRNELTHLGSPGTSHRLQCMAGGSAYLVEPWQAALWCPEGGPLGVGYLRPAGERPEWPLPWGDTDLSVILSEMSVPERGR